MRSLDIERELLNANALSAWPIEWAAQVSNDYIVLRRVGRNARFNQKEYGMSKGQNSKKGSKKKAAMTMQEKKVAKREKKQGLTSRGIVDQVKHQG